MFEEISNIDPTVVSLAKRNIQKQTKTLAKMQKQEMEETQKLINTITEKVLKAKPDADIEKLMEILNSYSFEQLVNLASSKIKQNGGGCSSCRKCKHGGDGWWADVESSIANLPIIKKYI